MSKAVTLLLALVAAVVVTVVIDLLITGKPVKRCKKMEIVSQSNSNEAKTKQNITYLVLLDLCHP
jgi:hypothetical protein